MVPMMSAGFGLFGLVGIAWLVGLVLGVIGLAKAGRSADWWMMASGAACSALGSVFSFLMMFGMFSTRIASSFSTPGSQSFWIAFSGLSSLGSILFAAGFAWHGTKAVRASSRHTELEMLVQAQSEEIQRLSSGT